MTDLLGPNGSPLQGGKVLHSRQLTVSLDPQHLKMLTDLAVTNEVSIHTAAQNLLKFGILEAHKDLRRHKFFWMLCNWAAWGYGKLPV